MKVKMCGHMQTETVVTGEAVSRKKFFEARLNKKSSFHTAGKTYGPKRGGEGIDCGVLGEGQGRSGGER